ncbi:MAG: hypothetical protein J6W37_05785 [Bacteroidales bacterium]|nr:hypothetical protein [Bacteroidales bacterium]
MKRKISESVKRFCVNAFLLLIMLIPLASFGYLILREMVNERVEVRTETDTIIEIHHDTLYSEPVEIEKYRYIVRYVTDTVFTSADSLPVVAEIPISQKMFVDTLRTDSDTLSYTAYVSGYRQSLDSMFVSVARRNTTVVQTITKQERRRRFGFGTSCGLYAGYDLSHRQFGTGVGVMIGMNYKF